MAFNKEKALKEAEKLVAKGKDREALVQYKEIVKNDPRDLNSLNKIGDLHLKLGQKTEAIDCFVQIAEKYAGDGFNLRAIAMYKKCTRTDPARIDFHERLADLNAQQGLVNDARTEYQLVADQYLKEGKAEKARAIYAKVAAMEPDNLKTRLKLADLYLKDNQLNLALGEYQVIGAELAKKGMLDESLQVLQKALALDPSNVQILRGIAHTHAAMGKADEGLRFIHQKLTEKGGNDPDLLLVMGETYQAAGNHDHARQALARASALAPDRVDVKQAAFRLCVATGDADGALAQYAPVADRLAREGKAGQVVEDLRAILKVQDGHVPTLEKLVTVLAQTNADSKLQSDWMGRLAEAYIARGQYAPAEGVLARLVQSEPEVAQHAEKLDFVRLKLKGGASAPAAAFAAPAAEESSFGSMEEPDSGFSMSFDDGELEAAATRGDDRGEFVSERTAEADVFIKYGLVDKAVEQLQGILQRYADDVGTRQKLKSLLAEEGRKGEAIEQCLAIADILRQSGDASGADEALAQARDIDPNHPALAGAAGAVAAPASGGFGLSFEAPAAPAAPVSAAPGAGGFTLSFDEPAAPAAPAPAPPAAGGFELSFESPSAAPSLEVSLDTPEPAGGGGFELSVEEPAAPTGEGEFEISMDEPATPSGGAEFELSVEEPAAAEAEFELSMDEPAAAPSSGGEFEISMDEPAAPSGAPEFELSMEEPSTAPSAPAAIEVEAPPAFELSLEPASPATAPVAEVLAAPPVPEPPAPAPAPAPVPAPAAAAEESLFGEEADFFNFADELNKELGGEEDFTQVSREGDEAMSLEQIISGIQSAVAKQVDQGDYETHYNLGIAYKEMGLQDEAIGEFQYASKDPTKFLQCCILLGACFVEKGMPELAVKWYEKGKGAPGITEEDLNALNFEIAQCRETMGDENGALAALMDVYASDARYRDVGQRIARLKQQAGR